MEGEKKSAEDKGRKKTGGRWAQTGSQPNQFGLAESGCTISHQSTFSMLSDRPSIHRGHPLSTLLGNRRGKKGKTKREKERNMRTRVEATKLQYLFGTRCAPAPHVSKHTLLD